MIAKLGKGAGFSGCAKYDLDQGHKNNKDARILAAEGVPLKVKPDGSITVNARDIGRAFRAQALALNPVTSCNLSAGRCWRSTPRIRHASRMTTW